MQQYQPVRTQRIEQVLDIAPSPTATPPAHSTAFIKLIGIPPPNSDNAVTMAPLDAALVGDPLRFCIDILEAHNEDPYPRTNTGTVPLTQIHPRNTR